MPGRPFCFSDPPEKHKLHRGRCDLASCKVSLNCAQQKKLKMSPSIRGQGFYLVFLIGSKTQQTWYRTLRSCFLSSFVEFCSVVSEEKSKMYQPIRGQGGHLVFPIGPKNTNSVEDAWILSNTSVDMGNVYWYRTW